MFGLLKKSSLLSVTLLLTVPATADPVCNVLVHKADEVSAYWTPERIQNAVPMPSPEISSEAFKALDSTELLPEDFSTPGLDLQSLSGPERADIKKAPFKHGGKVFFRLDGVDTWCSAQFAGSMKSLLSAAHCLKGEKSGDWAEYVYFSQGYSTGKKKTHDVVCVCVMSGWDPSSSFYWKYDYAFLRTRQASFTGYLGYKTGTAHSVIHAIGYPTNYENGKYMQVVKGEKGRDYSKIGVYEMENNPMRSGNSGGAWIRDIGQGDYAIGVNAYHNSGEPTSEWSPVFDKSTTRLLERVLSSSSCGM